MSIFRAACSTTGIPNVNRIYFSYRILTLFFLLFIGIYDYRHHLIKNTALICFSLWCLLQFPVLTLTGASSPLLSMLLHGILGAGLGFSLFLIISMATNGSIGGGDIKLVTILGFYYQAGGLFVIVLISCALALSKSLLSLILHKNKHSSIPFAPYLFLGCLFYDLF